MTEETRQIVKWKEKFLAYYEGTSDPETSKIGTGPLCIRIKYLRNQFFPTVFAEFIDMLGEENNSNKILKITDFYL